MVIEQAPLRERAARALEEWQAAETQRAAKAEREWRAYLGQRLQHWLETNVTGPLPVDLHDSTISIDGIMFEIIHGVDEFYSISLHGNCPKCRRDTLSQPLNNLVDVGRMLAHFTPHYGHTHPPVTQSRAEIVAERIRHCLRCGHGWVMRYDTREPKKCPRCNSPYWDRQRKTIRKETA